MKKKKNYLIKFVLEKKYLVIAISKMPEIDNNNIDGKNDDDNTLIISNFRYTIIDVKTKFKPNLIVLRKVWYDEKKETNIENYLNNLYNDYPSIMNEVNDSTIVLTFKEFLKEFSSLAVCFTKNWEEVHPEENLLK